MIDTIASAHCGNSPWNRICVLTRSHFAIQNHLIQKFTLLIEQSYSIFKKKRMICVKNCSVLKITSMAIGNWFVMKYYKNAKRIHTLARI